MKPERLLIILVAALALMAGGCKSHKKAAEAQAVAPAPMAEVEDAVWKNVYAPVSIEIFQPMQFAASGRITMVRGASIYLSMRMFGMEVGSAFADPDRAVMTVRMPKKMMMELPIIDLLRKGGMSFAEVQEALMGNEEALAKLPASVSYKADVTDRESVVELQATYAGKRVGVRLTWNLRQAEWDVKSPRQWSEPGSDYTRVTPEQAMKMLGGML